MNEYIEKNKIKQEMVDEKKKQLRYQFTSE